MTASFSSAHAATVKQWTKTVTRETVFGNTFAQFMGTDYNAPIRVMPQLESLTGDVAKYHLVPKLSPSSGVTGDAQLVGNGQDISIFVDEVTVTELGNAVDVRNKDISQQRVVVDLKQEQYDLLRDWNIERMRDDILTALTDVTAGRTQARYLYGNADANWNVTHATALGNVDSTNDKMSLDMIDLAVYKARYQGLRRMQPGSISTGVKGSPVLGYALFLHPIAARDLKKNPNLNNQIIHNDRMRAAASVFNGAFYMGEYAGAQIFEVPDVNSKMLLTSAGAGSINVTHNLLLGGQAAVWAWAMRPEFRLEMFDFERVRSVGLLQIRGVKKAVFDSEDWATVHIFASGAL